MKYFSSLCLLISDDVIGNNERIAARKKNKKKEKGAEQVALRAYTYCILTTSTTTSEAYGLNWTLEIDLAEDLICQGQCTHYTKKKFY